MTTREQIYGGLFSLLAGSASFTTTSRKFKHFADTNAADMPYLTMAQLHETIKNNGSGLPPSKEFHVEAYVYCAADQSATGATPSSMINPLLDAIEAALAPGVNGKQTLGGLVYHAHISDTITIEDGAIAGIAIAIIPILIRVTQ